MSEQTVKKAEIDIIRHGSVYDETKRSYEVPQFAITNKKLSVGNRFYSPDFNSSIARSFKMSARSNHFPSPTSSKVSDRYGVKEIRTGFDQKKVEISKRQPLKKDKDKIKSECIQTDDY